MRMGNCKSSPPPPPPPTGNNQSSSPTTGTTNNGIDPNAVASNLQLELHKTQTLEGNSTSALFQSIFTIAKPILRRIISKHLLDEVGVLKHEKRQPKYQLGQPEESLPIKPLKFSFQDVEIIDDPKILLNDMEEMPDFKWPEARRVEKLMDLHTSGRGGGMMVLDLLGVDLSVEFAEGVELIVPVELPFGKTVDLEIGSGGKIVRPKVRMRVPKMRVWFVHETFTLYAAFLEPLNLSPHIHVNADRGRGDFMNMTFEEEGSMDDVVERICSGFGPKKLVYTDDEDEEKSKKNKPSLAAKFLGGLIVRAMGTFGAVGDGRPIEADLKQTIINSVEVALGKARPSNVIKNDIKLLQEELQRAEIQENGQKGAELPSKAKKSEKKKMGTSKTSKHHTHKAKNKKKNKGDVGSEEKEMVNNEEVMLESRQDKNEEELKEEEKDNRTSTNASSTIFESCGLGLCIE